jgi:hemoglobin-like flavoprotein
MALIRRDTMTPRHIELVQSTLPAVLAIRHAAAALFYERLFVIDPTTRPLFARTDMSAQGAKLMSAIVLVVKSLDRFDAIAQDIRKLADRHESYGVKPHHYDSVGAALLWALEQGLGPAFTPEVRDAWTAAYVTLSGAMQCHRVTMAA